MIQTYFIIQGRLGGISMLVETKIYCYMHCMSCNEGKEIWENQECAGKKDVEQLRGGITWGGSGQRRMEAWL